ncbi:ABC transporter substrate-binding protein [Teredinibacter sp. KSP-S5-2]|uniref:substrate-binding periplasmic protein n=1 Tax=Teredinibacter sp. KSP-S5-2 TaxID=3034506 RepID=UPI00293435DA|nr:ABC transporter substrate-binding protein [Teredinibacter sp. KSP-S5-2]WNO11169.1 ABC transporter substrate-binding protein [Teredinibacter sp. KSP-S5-2]
MKKLVFSSLVLSLTVFVLCSSASAEPTPVITIAGVHLETRLTKGNSSQYNLLWKTMAKNGLNYDMTILPLSRTAKMFATVSDCVFPSSLNSVMNHFQIGKSESEFLASEPVDFISMRLFTRQSNDTLSSFKQLQNKRVAIWLGFDKDIFLKGITATIDEVESEEIRLKMLMANRVDAIIGFTPDVMIEAEELGYPIPHFDESLFVFKGEGASLICHNNAQNQKFVTRFNQTLERLRDSGELQKILGPHAKLYRD